MKGLNFTGWQKVGEDKKTTTLKHKKGHMITLAHSKLPKIQQEALKRLKLADGGQVSPPIDPAKAQSAQDSMRQAFKFADGGDVPAADPKAPVTVNVNPPAMSQPVQSAQPVPVAVPQAPPQPNVLLPNGSMNAPTTAQTAQGAAKLGAQVQAAQSAASVPQLQQAISGTANLNQDAVNNINELKSHTDALADYSKNNPLKENAYLENMGAGGKMKTAIGLILSGGGAGVNGQPNMAYDFLNKQIDRNIQAQKDRFGQKDTIWGAYKDLYGNEQVANNLARTHQLDMLDLQAKQTAAQLGTPAAAANYMKLSSELSSQKNKEILDAAGNLGSIPNNPAKGSKAAMPDQGFHQANPNQNLIDQGIVAPSHGMAGAQASIPSNQENPLIEPDPYADSSILTPNAQGHLDSLRYTPKAKEEIDQIKNQYTAAQQADTILGQLHNVHQTLYKDAQQGGAGGYFRRHDPTAAIPFIGEGVSRAGIQPLTDTQTNRDYETNRTRIVSDIANALKGSNVSGEEISRIVNANSPEHGDTPEMVAKKERAIRLFIKNNVNKSLLKDWGLAK